MKSAACDASSKHSVDFSESVYPEKPNPVPYPQSGYIFVALILDRAFNKKRSLHEPAKPVNNEPATRPKESGLAIPFGCRAKNEIKHAIKANA